MYRGCDVADALEKVRRKTGRPFKTIVNDTLRAGLRAGQTPQRYRLKPVHLGGVLPGVDLDGALAVRG